MLKIADGVWQLAGRPRDLINVYLIDDVLIDAGTRYARGRIFNQLGNRRLSMLALTHCHPDHQGVAHKLCEHYGIPLACHENDVAAMEGRTPMVRSHRLFIWTSRLMSGPPHRVDRALKEGDEVAGFRVYHMPGHTPGHVIYFREKDGVAIAGDLLANIHFIRLRPGLREPPRLFSHDAEENRRSILRFAALRPRVICFGHGPPLMDGKVLLEFAQRLQTSES